MFANLQREKTLDLFLKLNLQAKNGEELFSLKKIVRPPLIDKTLLLHCYEATTSILVTLTTKSPGITRIHFVKLEIMEYRVDRGAIKWI